MALFGNKEESKAKKAAPSKKRKKVAVVSPIAYKVLVKPRITEKAHASLGMNKYVFEVAAEATKGSVKQSIEAVYGVSVIGVNMVNIPRKKRAFGRTIGYKSGFKKAIVTLKEGESIELFQEA